MEFLGIFVLEKIYETGADEMMGLLRDIALYTVNVITGVASIAVELYQSSKGALEIPPVLPHQLVALCNL